MYGGDGARESRPNFVSADWKVASEFVKDYKGTVSWEAGQGRQIRAMQGSHRPSSA